MRSRHGTVVKANSTMLVENNIEVACLPLFCFVGGSGVGGGRLGCSGVDGGGGRRAGGRSGGIDGIFFWHECINDTKQV